MPKRPNYESDGGFVEDAPSGKKRKGAGHEPKQKDGKRIEMSKDAEGNEYWEISRTRRVQISSFKGTQMVSIREYYEKDGAMLPGKKGISLSMDQFIAVIDILPQVESILQSKGIDVPRPDYDQAANGHRQEDQGETEAVGEEANSDDDGDDNEEAGADDAPSRPSGRPVKSRTKKANHEATDDEDE